MRVAPRNVAEILHDATVVLGRNWRSLVLPSLLAFIPAGALTLLVFRWTGATEFLEVVLDQRSLQALSPDVLAEIARPFVRASFMALGIQVVAAVFVLLSCHHVVAADIAGNPTTWRSATRFSARKMIPTLMAVVLAGVPVVAALVIGLTVWLVPAAGAGSNPAVSLVGLILLAAFLAPGLWLLTSFSMTTVVSAIEAPGVSGALARSLRLVKGRRLPTLGFLVLVGLLGWIAIELIQLVAIPVALVGTGGTPLFIASVLGISVQGLIVAAIGVPLTVWYADLRARSEGLVSEDLG